ncbi:beta-1,6-glucan synthase [Methylobacillus arboreus]|uniref:glycoside hydrolase family 17 protein n=1 Tax=Methylobacillus arboreus TaxID=755170 RepID=UPI001E4733C9|nr:glycosyl hydrolase family 17 protein [Methylobacillus arboreus]MCB5189851.1 beta-1,6-glucan synthase [Methylobacillus arboreus]
MLKTAALWRYSIFNFLLIALLAHWFWQQNQPIALLEPELPASGKLNCVSYAPYYGKGETPFVATTVAEKSRIERDLRLLSERFDCVRTYSVKQGLDYVPEAASKLGMKVLLGAWVGYVKLENDKEVDLAIKLANRYPETVKGLIIGNEVLLRKEQTEDVMLAYLEEAQRRTEVPVTYADVWEFWLKHPRLEQAVDYLTVHILPYWEDDPQNVDNAIHHAETVMESLGKTFSKPLFIGETGWPSVGKHRNDSIPSLVNQASYLRQFIQTAHDKGWNYNLIEAIDQPWKRDLEGTVGGYWGMYDTDLNSKFEFTGPVAERDDGWQPIIWAFAGFILFFIITIARKELRLPALVAMGSLGILSGATAYIQWDYLIAACRDLAEWIALVGIVLVGIAALLNMPALLARRQNKVVHSLLFILVLTAMITSFLLIPKMSFIPRDVELHPVIGQLIYMMDGRYRNFPLALYALPALQYAIGLSLLGILHRTTFGRYRRLNIIAIISALICLVLEPLNTHALLWLGVVALLAYASWPRKGAKV